MLAWSLKLASRQRKKQNSWEVFTMIDYSKELKNQQMEIEELLRQ